MLPIDYIMTPFPSFSLCNNNSQKISSCKNDLNLSVSMSSFFSSQQIHQSGSTWPCLIILKDLSVLFNFALCCYFSSKTLESSRMCHSDINNNDNRQNRANSNLCRKLTVTLNRKSQGFSTKTCNYSHFCRLHQNRNIEWLPLTFLIFHNLGPWRRKGKKMRVRGIKIDRKRSRSHRDWDSLRKKIERGQM